MTRYQRDLQREILQRDLLAAISRGDGPEITRLNKRLWANAHEQANEDREAGL